MKHGILDNNVSGCYQLCPDNTKRSSDGGCVPTCNKPNKIIEQWNGKDMIVKCKRHYKIVSAKTHKNKEDCGNDCVKQQLSWVKSCPKDTERLGTLCMHKCLGKSSLYFCNMDKVYTKFLGKPKPMMSFKENTCYSGLKFISQVRFKGVGLKFHRIMFDVADSGRLIAFNNCNKKDIIDMKILKKTNYEINGTEFPVILISATGKDSLDVWLSNGL